MKFSNLLYHLILNLLYLTKQGSKPMYNILNLTNVSPVGKEKWSKHFVITEKQWISIFHLPFTITSDFKFQWLQ